MKANDVAKSGEKAKEKVVASSLEKCARRSWSKLLSSISGRQSIMFPISWASERDYHT